MLIIMPLVQRFASRLFFFFVIVVHATLFPYHVLCAFTQNYINGRKKINFSCKIGIDNSINKWHNFRSINNMSKINYINLFHLHQSATPTNSKNLYLYFIVKFVFFLDIIWDWYRFCFLSLRQKKKICQFESDHRIAKFVRDWWVCVCILFVWIYSN